MKTSTDSSTEPSRVRTTAIAPRHINEDSVTARANLVEGYKLLTVHASSVVLVGAGGIGGEIGVVLARKGIGRLTIFDPDIVEMSNLNRQRFFSDDLDKPKAMALAQNLGREATDEMDIAGYACRIEDAVANGINPNWDVAVCGVDSDATRAFCAQYFLTRNIPCIFIGVSRNADRGYVFVQESRADTPCWICVFPDGLEEKPPNPCPAGATPDILKVVAGYATYALDSLIMPRPRNWNFQEVSLRGDAMAGHRTVEQRPLCPICRSIGVDV